MEFVEPEVIVVADFSGNPEQACGAFFNGDYHYCGEYVWGFVLCCLGGDLH